MISPKPYINNAENNHESCRVGSGNSELNIQIHLSSQRDAMLKLWKMLDGKISQVPIACSYLWVKNWVEHYGDLVGHRYVVAIKDLEPIGITLLTEGVNRSDGPFRVRSLHLGTAGEPDADSVCVEYNNLLIAQENRADFANCLHELFHQEQEWDEFCFDGWNYEALQKMVPLNDHDWVVRKTRSYYFDLNNAREQCVQPRSQLGKATRKAISRNTRFYGDVQSEWADSIDQAEDIFKDLIRLHQARWQSVGQPGCYNSDRFLSFHASLIRELIPEKKMGLFRLTNQQGVVGCVQMLFDNQRALSYQGGTVELTGNRSPGLLTDIFCIEACLERGYSAYDLLGGDSIHKRRISTNSNTLVWAKYRRKRFKFQVSRIARGLKKTFSKKSVESEQGEN